jgi:hypothetical protein
VAVEHLVRILLGRWIMDGVPIGMMRGSAFQAEPRDSPSVSVAVLIHHRTHAPPVMRRHRSARGAQKISRGS